MSNRDSMTARLSQLLTSSSTTFSGLSSPATSTAPNASSSGVYGNENYGSASNEALATTQETTASSSTSGPSSTGNATNSSSGPISHPKRGSMFFSKGNVFNRSASNIQHHPETIVEDSPASPLKRNMHDDTTLTTSGSGMGSTQDPNESNETSGVGGTGSAGDLSAVGMTIGNSMANAFVAASTRLSGLMYERSVTKTRGTEVSLTAWSYLMNELVQYSQSRVSGIGEFEERLNSIGYAVGRRVCELLPLREHVYPTSSGLRAATSSSTPTRHLRLLSLLSYIHSNMYKALFGKTADSLEKSTENDDEYMIGDNDMLVTRSIDVPKEMTELSCGALVAGVVEAVMDGAGFPARVTAHSVPTAQYPRRTIILIKLDPSVLARENAQQGVK